MSDSDKTDRPDRVETATEAADRAVDHVARVLLDAWIEARKVAPDWRIVGRIGQILARVEYWADRNRPQDQSKLVRALEEERDGEPK
jgi:hypothetical protein